MNVNSENAYNRAAALCAKSEHCISDIRKKLYTWHLEEEEHNKVIDKLIKGKFIDEIRYANAFAREKFIYNKWGTQKITYTLMMKGIPHEIIEQAIEKNIDSEQMENQLTALLNSKIKHIKAKTSQEYKQKLMRFGASRGYTMEQITKAIKDINLD